MRDRAEEESSCCCGRSQCAYLKHNTSALEGLEKDLQNAAQIGQALLVRHEAYMAEAEEERRKMGLNVDKLEQEKKDLETSNAKTIEENRYYLDQLEQLNRTVSSSDAQILALNTTLQSTRRELDRLTVLAARTSELEAQLLAVESEQSNLQFQLVSREEEGRSAVQRWKGAERTISILAGQIERIEEEAQEERNRHADVIARFERQRSVQKELENAAGRLKGAAAATTLRENGSNNVVSHFVKDILQDNASLQMGIVELREMLMGSNAEVESLREQLILHQPMIPKSQVDVSKSFLDGELAQTPTSENTSDLHVHHHYHAAPSVGAVKYKAHPLGLRKSKKRRDISVPGLFTPDTDTTSSAATILSQTSVSIPPKSQPFQSGPWPPYSMRNPSTVASPSLPSSPLSAHRDMSIFDSMDDALLSSRPTTPGSNTFESPDFQPSHAKRGSDGSIPCLSAQTCVPGSSPSLVHPASGRGKASDNPTPSLFGHDPILEEPEKENTSPSFLMDVNEDLNVQEDYISNLRFQPRLQRASSHESLLSRRGIDVPQLRSKRSQLLGNGSNSRTSLGACSMSVAPITSSTAAIGRPLRSAKGYDSTNYNRLLLAQASTSPTTAMNPSDKSTFGKRMGGWITGKWGVAPTDSGAGRAKAMPPDANAKAALTAIDAKSACNRGIASSLLSDSARRYSTHIEAIDIDSNLLLDSLEERE